MAWKPHTQMSFADERLIDHDSLLELDDINTFIDWTRFETESTLDLIITTDIFA
jgi:hypothetical protein